MATLPVSTDLTGSAITEAQAKTWFTQLRDFLSGLLGTAGTVPNALATLQVPFGQGVEAKAGAYTVVAADRGKTLSCSGTWTLALTAAATLGNGFMISVVNTGSGVITIDPSGKETIDGAATFDLGAGLSIILVCTGSGWVSATKSTTPYTRATLAAGSSVYQDAGSTSKYSTGAYPTPLPARSNEAAIAKAIDSDGASSAGRLFFLIKHNGTVTLSLDLRSGDTNTANARALKNGSQIGSWTRSSSTAATYTTNVNVSIGDIIELQCQSSATMGYAYISNAKLLVAAVPTDDF